MLLARLVNSGDEPRTFALNETLSGLCRTAGLAMRSMVETTLSGNRLRREVQPLQWHAGGEAREKQQAAARADAEASGAGGARRNSNFNVTLIPREVRTWSITFSAQPASAPAS